MFYKTLQFALDKKHAFLENNTICTLRMVQRDAQRELDEINTVLTDTDISEETKQAFISDKIELEKLIKDIKSTINYRTA